VTQGHRLSLRIGSFQAEPVPAAVVDALTELQVSTSVGSQSGFQMKFTLGKQSPIAQSLIPSGYFDPRRRVVITVTTNGTSTVIMDGIITKQDVTPGAMPGQSTLTVTGLDISALMDFIDLTGIPYPAMPLFAIVALILAKYLPFGVIPLVIPNIIGLISNPLERFKKQQGTDYQYVTNLARENGHVFYIDPGPAPGQSIAYWGPELGAFFPTQPALSIDLDAATNVTSMNFSYDGLAAKQYLVTILEPNTKIPIPIPIPNLDILKATLSKTAPPPLKSQVLGEMTNKSVTEALSIIFGALTRSADAITCSGQLDVVRYGRVLKARQKVAVRGAGKYYDGLYNVKSVTHNIKRGAYTQSFTLKRGGVGSSVDRVTV
jgi:hypothetical protein